MYILSCNDHMFVKLVLYAIQQSFPNRRMRTWVVCTGRTGTRPASALHLSVMLVSTKEGQLYMVHYSPRAVREEPQNVFMFAKQRVCRRLYPYHGQQVRHLWPAIWLRGWNFAGGSTAVAGSSLHPFCWRSAIQSRRCQWYTQYWRVVRLEFSRLWKVP